MITENKTTRRSVKKEHIPSDLVVIGGGLAGTCCAITAARAGLKVTLVQDRPVLGGNASSEVRLWILGATSHMGNNNRWAREGGVIDEILVENTYRNPAGNTLILDTILLEKVVLEPNITLLLNTAMYEIEKEESDCIKAVKAFCSQNSTQYHLSAPYFCDASGDGILAFQAGASFRMGAESKEEFDEKFAPDADYGHLLGHTIYFYTKDIGKPVRFVPPAYALDDISEIPRYKNLDIKSQGCQLWWLEYGGRLDTIHQSEEIKWELWKVVYGIWNYIKNSGKFPEAETKTLEWVGTIPGKRESRRFTGDYMITQKDIVEQRNFDDAVSFGGWAIDLHPADGIYSDKPGCNQWHAKGVYPIPFRSLYSKDIENLFLAGRIISATHVAFGSTRVMATCATNAQAVGMAAALCIANDWTIKSLTEPNRMKLLQTALLKSGQYIPGLALHDEHNLAEQASISVSSELNLRALPADGPAYHLEDSVAQMIPIIGGTIPGVTLDIKSKNATNITVQWRISELSTNHTPEVILDEKVIPLKEGTNHVLLSTKKTLSEDQYVFLTFLKNEEVYLPCSQLRVTGLLTVFNNINPAVSNYGKQQPGKDIGVDSFEFWCPARRPGGHNLALTFESPLQTFNKENLTNGYHRPISLPNAWVAEIHDTHAELILSWDQPKKVSRLVLHFDADFDHPMESSLMGHPEAVMPFVTNDYNIYNDQDELIFEQKGNHQAINHIHLDKPLETTSLKIVLDNTDRVAPVSVFGVQVYG